MNAQVFDIEGKIKEKIQLPKCFSYEIREDIKNNEKLFFDAGLRRVENNTDTWMHLDCAEKIQKQKDIVFF